MITPKFMTDLARKPKNSVNKSQFTQYQQTLYDSFHQKWEHFRNVERRKKNNPNVINISGQSHARKPVTTNKNISALKPIKGCNLRLDEVNLNVYLRLRIVHKCFIVVSVSGLGEDSEGHLFQFSVYNFPFKGKHYDEYFQPGKSILIKEPYFKTGQAGNIFIRIDDPEDLIFENDKTEEPTVDKIFQQIRKEGRQHVLAKNYLEAFVTYTQGLKQIAIQQQRAILWINKAICCLKLNLKQEHRQCADEALKADPSNPKKPFYHQIKNCILRDNYEGARELLKKNGQILGQQQLEILRIQMMEKQLAARGKFNWKRILMKNDMVQFFKEGLKIEKGKNGTGIFAKEKIASGTFLISEKPMMWQKVQIQKREWLEEFSADITKSVEDTQFETKLLKLAKHSPQFNRKLKRLYRKGLAGVSLAERSNGKDLSIDEIIQAKNMNSFYTDRLPEFNQEEDTQFCLHRAFLMYDICSMLNHSCEPNCKYFHVGSSMVVFAFEDILPGQELFIQYTEESDILESKWGIKCCCAYCKDSKNSIKKRVEALRKKVMNKGSISLQESAEIERLHFFQIGISSLFEGRSDICASFLLKMFGLDGRQAKEVMDRLEIKAK